MKNGLRPLGLESLESRRLLAVTEVTTIDDLEDAPDLSSIAALNANPGPDGEISLREAIEAANNGAGADEIFMNLGTSAFTMELDDGFEITDSVKISANPFAGSGATEPQAILDADNSFRVFDIKPDSPTGTIDVNLTNLTMYQGAAGFQNGGGIRTERANLTMEGVDFESNTARLGGGLFVKPSDNTEVSLSSSILLDNSSDISGGGIAVGEDSSSGFVLGLTRTLVKGNTTGGGGGGGLDFRTGGTSGAATLELKRAWFESNTTTGSGGAVNVPAGLSNIRDIQVEGSTFLKNTAGDSGGGVSISSARDSEITFAGLEIANSVIPTVFEENTANGTSDLTLPVVFTPRKAGGGGLFVDATDSTVELSDVFATLNKTTDEGSDRNDNADGGGLFVNVQVDTATGGSVESNITVNRVTAFDNESAGDGGGLMVVGVRSVEDDGNIDIVDSTFEGNTAVGDGGGIYGFIAQNVAGDPEPTNVLAIRTSSFHGNDAGGNGGGALICAKFVGTAEIENSTFANNDATLEGGGIAFASAALEEELIVTMTNSTVAGNKAADGGGLFLHPNDLEFEGAIDLTLNNTIVSSNTTTLLADNNIGVSDLLEVNSDSANNFVGTGDGGLQDGTNSNIVEPTAVPNVDANDPDLAPLGDYGGATKTMIPNSSSPVLDRGSNSLSPSLLDQRGEDFKRILNSDGVGASQIDIGAAELSRFVKVVDVEIISTNDEVYDVPGLGEQIRTVPQGSASNSVRISFNRPVDVAVGDLVITGAPANATLTCGAMDGCNSASYSATWSLGTGVAFENGSKSLTLSGVEFAGQSLDGDWTNPTCLCDVGKQFPSGDDSNSGNFEFDFSILDADADRDLTVGFGDFLQVSTNFGEAWPWLSHIDGDTDVDGTVGFADFLRVSAEFGNTLVPQSCSCSSSAAMGGGGAASGGAARSMVVIENRRSQREESLAMFRELQEEEDSLLILSMGMSLLEKMWEQAGATEDWIGVENDLFEQTIGLRKASESLTRRIAAVDSKVTELR